MTLQTAVHNCLYMYFAITPKGYEIGCQLVLIGSRIRSDTDLDDLE